MSGNAITYWTDTIIDASPDYTQEVAIGRIDDIAGNTYGQHLAVEVSVTVTPGADATTVYFFVAPATSLDDRLGNIVFEYPATEDVPQTCSFVVQGQIPVSVGAFAIAVGQNGASADGTITALTAVALVGS